MVLISSYIYRGELIESQHNANCLIKNEFKETILSTNNDNALIYPRSAIKIFQALPFINSKAHKLTYFSLGDMACYNQIIWLLLALGSVSLN